MRVALLPLVLLLGVLPQRLADEPAVAMGLWYAGPGAQPPSTATGDVEALRRDLAVVRRAGYNAVTTWVNWKEGEPTRGAYALAGTERLVAAAAEAELQVSLVVFTEPAPAWAPGVPDAAAQFFAYVSKRLSLQRGVTRVVQYSPALDRPGRIKVAPGSGPDARLAMWSAVARGERAVAFQGSDGPLSPTVLSLGETAGVITRNPSLFDPLRPRAEGVRSIAAEGGGAPVEIRLLESANALMIIGLNHSPSPRKATVSFLPDIPEAIWQNLETGTQVHFVMGKSGPVLEHAFAPRDALVLMIRKRLR
ncbi:MAG: beta-galactosidase [Acidobacteria bacterium]|nr:beta-galactosidase [Acidobacteriota bacterium]